MKVYAVRPGNVERAEANIKVGFDGNGNYIKYPELYMAEARRRDELKQGKPVKQKQLNLGR